MEVISDEILDRSKDSILSNQRLAIHGIALENFLPASHCGARSTLEQALGRIDL